jgi:predicted DNA-binding protein (MmcQ/YjbR family)
MAPSPIARLRKLCLALPEAHEVEAWDAPTFRVKNKIFAMYVHTDSDHGGGRPAVWCKSTAINQGFMIRAKPARFFKPPYVGPSGWIGIWLDKRPNWAEVDLILRDGYRLIAPKKLAVLVED